MPDSAKSTLSTPIPARRPADAPQSTILELAAELRRLDERLDEIASGLPQVNGEFNLLAEIRGAVDVVRSDLLADAIEP